MGITMKFIQTYNGYNIWQNSDGVYEAWRTSAFVKGFTREDVKYPVGKGVFRQTLAAKTIAEAMDEIDAIKKGKKKPRTPKDHVDPGQTRIE